VLHYSFEKLNGLSRRINAFKQTYNLLVEDDF
jgi:hypothetical protein